MKQLIGIITLFLFSTAAQAQTPTAIDNEIRYALVDQVEIEIGQAFFREVVEAQTSGPKAVGWLDGGRAVTERKEILRDLAEIKILLQQIETLEGEEITSAAKMTAGQLEKIRTLWADLRLAVDALPSNYSEVKKATTSLLDLFYQHPPYTIHRQVVGEEVDIKRVNFLQLAELIVNQIGQLEEIYTNEIKPAYLKSQTGELVVLKVKSAEVLAVILIGKVEEHKLTDAELHQIVHDLSTESTSFRGMFNQFRSKLAYHFHGIDCWDTFRNNVASSINRIQSVLGYGYATFTPRTDKRYDNEGYRLTEKKLVQREHLPIEERIARLSKIVEAVRR